jgi:hypothetical protein
MSPLRAPAYQHRLLVPSRVTRAMRCVAYVAIVLAGVGLVLADHVFGPWYNAMGWFSIVGGVLCAAGVATGRWVGEYIGLPLLASAMFAFTALTYRDTFDAVGWVAVPSVALLAAYGILLTSRWLDVCAVVRAAHGHALFHKRLRGRGRGTE